MYRSHHPLMSFFIQALLVFGCSLLFQEISPFPLALPKPKTQSLPYQVPTTLSASRGYQRNLRPTPTPTSRRNLLLSPRPPPPPPPPQKHASQLHATLLHATPTDVKLFLLCLSATFLVRTFIVEPRYIPSLSMFPGLDVGDHILVEKVSKRLRQARVGDVVVFGLQKKKHYIKRVVAVGGDEVDFRDCGTVFVNKIKPNEPFVKDGEGSTILGEANNKLNASGVVPEGRVLVLGDNRRDSIDGRVWGWLQETQIIGRAFFRYWPLRRMGCL